MSTPSEIHVYHCFDVLLSKLEKRSAPSPSFPNDKYPLFVTWKTIGDHKSKSLYEEPRLRGCIGNFSPMELHKGIPEYALISAFKDSRFSPITKEEVEYLECTVSLLTDFEDAEHALDWEIGVHGIRIAFNEVQRNFGATFLPEVAKEQGWDHKETLRHLVRKAGYNGKLESVLNSISVIRYQSKLRTISYKEYVLHKNKNFQ